jgi:hypothetical protein
LIHSIAVVVVVACLSADGFGKKMQAVMFAKTMQKYNYKLRKN